MHLKFEFRLNEREAAAVPLGDIRGIVIERFALNLGKTLKDDAKMRVTPKPVIMGIHEYRTGLHVYSEDHIASLKTLIEVTPMPEDFKALILKEFDRPIL